MIITDYYLLREIKPTKSHRFDCVASTAEYPPFELIAQKARGKVFFCYYNGVPDNFSAKAQRRADRAITNGKNISSVYIPDLNSPLLGFGDVMGTLDGLLFRFSEDYKQIEIFVARGYKNDIRQLFQLFADGELSDELQEIQSRVKQPTE